MFEKNNVEAIITDINQLPKNTFKIEFWGQMPMSAKEDLIINVNFKDKNNNILNDSFNYNEIFKKRIKETFNVDAQFHINLGHMYKAIFGSNPSKTIEAAFKNNELIIDTTRKIEKDAILDTRVYFEI